MAAASVNSIVAFAQHALPSVGQQFIQNKPHWTVSAPAVPGRVTRPSPTAPSCAFPWLACGYRCSRLPLPGNMEVAVTSGGNQPGRPRGSWPDMTSPWSRLVTTRSGCYSARAVYLGSPWLTPRDSTLLHVNLCHDALTFHPFLISRAWRNRSQRSLVHCRKLHRA